MSRTRAKRPGGGSPGHGGRRTAVTLRREVLESSEEGLGHFLGDVAVRVVRSGRGVPLAWSAGEMVALSVSALALPEAALRRVLAHEFAHVVQRRNARVGGHVTRCGALLEAEAHAAAVEVAAGRRRACVLADGEPWRARAWGVAGHYFTAYMMMLAAKVEPFTAYRMAFYAQMPDQVNELDAHEAGNDYFLGQTARDLNPFNGPIGILMSGGPSEPSYTARAMDIRIQRGLHCLKGGSSAEETARRRQVLMEAPIGTLEFGLAIHPYGDSFAHRVLADPGRLYPAGLGHGIEKPSGREHEPDQIKQRPDLYREYGMSFYDIVCTKQKPAGGFVPSLGWNETQALLDDVSKKDDDGSQVSRIKELCAERLTALNSAYAPEWGGKDAAKMNWSDFVSGHPKWGAVVLRAEMLQQCQTFAQKWA